jgi:O-antigen/teichoic acid export membrane protein
MTTGRILARNVLFNLGGQVIPLAAAIVAIPKLIAALGASGFGILTLVWAAIGYFGLFDLGLGRALTHAIAVRLGGGETDELGSVTWTGLALMFVFGLVGGFVVGVFTPLLVDHALNVPAEARAETRLSFYLMAAAIPVTLVATGFRGVLEAFQDFPVASVLRVPLAMLNYLAPLAVLPFSHRLAFVVAALAGVRLLGCVLHGAVCLHRYDFLRREGRIDATFIPALLRYGGLLTVTNVISPLMSTLDRFLVGVILPMAAVAYYVTPFEIVTKLYVVPTALLGVLFPAFAATFAADRERTAMLVDRGTRVVLLCVFPASLAFACFAHEGLLLWINAEFARESAPILQWLAVGVLINCAGQVAYTALQAIGRPDLTAAVHVVELPLYVAGIWVLTTRFGLVGVAMAWTFRVAIDTAALMTLTARAIPAAGRGLARCAWILALCSAALACAALLPTFSWRLAGFVGEGIVLLVLGWLLALDRTDRALVRRSLEALRARAQATRDVVKPESPHA